MNWNRLFNRLKRPATGEDDLNEELEFHRAMKEREFTAQGMTPTQARDASRRALGNLTLAREDARAEWNFQWLAEIIRDLRYAGRTLAAQPAFTVAAVLALVLGIGVNAILFNIYNALALTPWAVRDASHVVKVMEETDGNWNGMSWPAFRYLRDHTKTLAGLTASDTTGCRVTRGQASWMANGIAADENFFDVLGTGFAAGRGFSPRSNGNLHDPAPEVVLHYDEWMTRFGGERSVIGEWIELNGHKLQIVGVAAEGFSGPVPVSPNLWIPAAWRDLLHPGTASIDNPHNCCARVIGRLKDGTGQDQAQAELNTLSAQFNREVKRDPSRVLLAIPTMLSDPKTKRESSSVFLAVGVASLLILLLACANVANLQLARSAARRREFAVRVSLGASRGRILRQLLVEGMLLSAVAGLATAVLSSWAPTAIMHAFAANTDASGRLNFSFSNDWKVVVFVTVLSFAAAMLFGLGPAWNASRSSVTAGLQEGGRSTATGRMRTTLLAIQVILCTVLLSGASLLVRALNEAQRANVGFLSNQMVVANPNLDSSGSADALTVGLTSTLMERYKTLAGVEAVAHAVVVPLGNRNDSVGIDLPGSRQHIVFAYNRVSANFFDAMGVAIVAGRSFTEADKTRKDAVIVNETLAKRAWPNVNPLGKELLDGRLVVGVVRDFHLREIGPSSEPGAFSPAAASIDSQILIRHSAAVDGQVLATQAVKLARAMDRRLAMTSVQPYAAIIDRSRQIAVLVAAVAGSLSTLALILACVGIYGVAAYSVSQRTREIGIRMALGAKPASIAGMVLNENLRVVLIGALVGIVGAVAFGRLLTNLLYGIKPGDPTALAATIGILLATAGLAAWAPARRAAAIDPAITLRHD